MESSFVIRFYCCLCSIIAKDNIALFESVDGINDKLQKKFGIVEKNWINPLCDYFCKR
jgi:hypothetical protein